jgi:DNA-binding transcriptional LysR family regulator
VKISTVEGLGTHWLPREVAIFNERYPDITIDIQIENRVVDLKLREADIALRLVRPYQGDLITKKLTNYGFGLYADGSYLERHGTPSIIEDLAQHQMVGMPQQVFRGIGFSDEEWVHLEKAKTVVQTNSPSAHIGATSAGLGIGLHSHRWASSFPNLVRVLPEINLDKVGVWIVSHEDLRHSARIRAVFDFLSERITSQRKLFEEGRR